MTVSLKVHVNGKYRATVKHTANGVEQPDTVVGPQEEKPIYFQHGVENVLTVTEEYLGADWTPEKDAEAG